MAHILVVDDDAGVRESIRRTLAPLGHDVVTLDDGSAVLAAIERERPELVISDIFMPGQDGIVTLLQIRKAYPAIPVIVVSGGDSTGRIDLRKDAELLGAVRTLAKPFSPGALVDVVVQVLG